MDKWMLLDCEATLNISWLPCWNIIEHCFYTYKVLEGCLSETKVEKGYLLVAGEGGLVDFAQI